MKGRRDRVELKYFTAVCAASMQVTSELKVEFSGQVKKFRNFGSWHNYNQTASEQGTKARLLWWSWTSNRQFISLTCHLKVNTDGTVLWQQKNGTINIYTGLAFNILFSLPTGWICIQRHPGLNVWICSLLCFWNRYNILTCIYVYLLKSSWAVETYSADFREWEVKRAGCCYMH